MNLRYLINGILEKLPNIFFLYQPFIITAFKMYIHNYSKKVYIINDKSFKKALKESRAFIMLRLLRKMSFIAV